MTAGLEYRDAGSVLEVNPGDHTVALRIVNYNGGPLKRADSYGSIWAPGVFGESLADRPRIPAAWSHDWSRIIGSLKEHTERADGLDGLVQLGNIDEVPDAKMAWSLLRDGHVDNSSFGFKRKPGGWKDTRNDADKMPGERERLHNARLDEVSPVLRGAVDGAGVLAVRAEGGLVRIEDAQDLLGKLVRQEITYDEAQRALEGIEPRSEPVVEDEIEPIELSRRSLEEAWALMRADGLVSRHESRLDTAPAATERLKAYWTTGEGAAKIAWGTGGDFARCETEVGKYVPAKDVKGYCANLHKRATGAWPGHAPGEGGRADGGRESETESSP